MFKAQRVSNFSMIVASHCLALSAVFGSHAVATEAGKVESKVLFNCNLSFTATGRSAYIVIGGTNIQGTGMMTCYDFLKNVIEDIPIKVTIRGPGVGIGITGLNISGGQRGLGINESPDSLLGDYLVLRGNAAVGVGGAASTGIRIGKGSIQLTAQVEATSGLGAGLDLLTFSIERDSTRIATSSPAEIVSKAPSSEVTIPLEAVVPAPMQAVVPAQPAVVQVTTSQVIELVDSNGRKIGRYQFKTN
jgi:hypothetical protein